MADTPDSLPGPTADSLPGPTPDYETPSNVGMAGAIVARASTEYRIKRYALVLLLFGYGLWSSYDGFYKMPRENAADLAAHPGSTKLRHPAYDIPLNEAFGVTLPPLAVVLLGWSLYASRGEYRLDPDDVLRLPGHPPIPLASIQAVDRGKWDRKGIAYLDYPGPDTAVARAKLDDFIYRREPTDRIFDRVMAAVETPVAPVEPSPDTPAVDASPSLGEVDRPA